MNERTDGARKGRRGTAAWALLLLMPVLAIAILLALLLMKRPEKNLADAPAPSWTLTLFEGYHGDVEGDTVKLEDLRGKGVVLNFWASWCQPCEQEARDLEAASLQYKDRGVVFVGIDYLDQEPAARRYLQKFGITYANGPDLGGKISRMYTIRGVPETFFINEDGVIVGERVVGAINSAELARRISQIIP